MLCGRTTNTRPSYGRNLPKWSYTILNRGDHNASDIKRHQLITERLIRLLGSPEKAAVGGSIPSLATTKTLHISLSRSTEQKRGSDPLRKSGICGQPPANPLKPMPPF